MYAGVTCKKCGKGCNKDVKIRFIPNFINKQNKKYGGYVCSDCITELAGGVRKLKNLQQQSIKKQILLNE